MSDISKFFTALSERAYKENDLSDVTYAMCEANLSFRQFFLDFFFSGKLNAGEVTLQREHSTEWGRPDFWIRTKTGELYIIEVKIWDGSHHFEQYFNILNGDKGPNNPQDSEANNKVWNRLGYIANYEIEYKVQNAYMVGQNDHAKRLCSVRTWKEFGAKLKNYEMLNSQLVEAYLDYLKRVCPYDEFVFNKDWKIEMAHFESVRAIYLGIEDAIKNQDLKLYWRSSRYFVPGYRMGCFFEIPQYQNGRSVLAWFGVYYTNDGGIPCVEFEDRDAWGGLVCEKFRKAYREVIRQQFSFRIYAEKDGKYSPDKDGKFNPDEFLKAVLKSVRLGALENGLTAEVVTNKHYAIKGLQAMKCLPMAIERYFFSNDDFLNKLKENKYELMHDADGGNAELPHSHCGRFYKLLKNDANGNAVSTIRGWLGVIYVNDNNRVPEGAKFVVEIDRAEVVRRFGSERGEWQDDSWGWASHYWDGGSAAYVIQEAANKILSLISMGDVNEAQK